MNLIDTSVWIEVKAGRLDLSPAMAAGEVVTFLPIVQEVLQGIRDDAMYADSLELMTRLPRLEDPLGEPLFRESIELYRGARARGITVRSWIDCLIAAAALRNDVEIWHRDRDFDALASFTPLRVRAL